ncbi:MAG: conjugal transfer protein TrbF [Pseudomonadota bacterium]
MWPRTQQSYGATPDPITPYQRAAQVWDDRIGSARVQAANWRLAAFASLVLAILMSGAFVWQSTQSLVTPYVIELEANGEVRAVTPATSIYDPTDAQIAYLLADFIRNVRSVSIDPVVVRENWLEAYNFTTDRAALTLNDYARAHDPFADVGRRSTIVDIASVVRSSDDSFEVRWRETRFLNGANLGAQTFTASLSIILEPPRDEAALHRNPLGVYVHGINWSQDLIMGE